MESTIGDETLAALVKSASFLDNTSAKNKISNRKRRKKTTSVLNSKRYNESSDLGKYFRDSVLTFEPTTSNTNNTLNQSSKLSTNLKIQSNKKNDNLQDSLNKSLILTKSLHRPSQSISNGASQSKKCSTLHKTSDLIGENQALPERLETTTNDQDLQLSIPMDTVSEIPSVISSQDKVKLAYWGLPLTILGKYEKRGITSMFPWQVECLSNPMIIDQCKNLVYSAPTSAGKTLVSEILVIKSVLERRKKAIFILPFVSLVREKMYYFQELLSDSGVRVEGFMGGIYPPGGFSATDVAIATIEKANSLINQMMEAGGLENLGVVVIDELHLLGDPFRGYLLELLLTKLKYMTLKVEEINIQLIGMSATLPNLDLLAKWLDAELFKTDFRPVPLKEFCKIGTTICDKNLNFLKEIDSISEFENIFDSDNVVQLCLETIMDGHSVLIFCPTKNWTESLAQQIANVFNRLGRQDTKIGKNLQLQLNTNAIIETMEQLKRSTAGLDNILKSTISFGVAFHHAGLTIDERDIIEGAFRSGSIRVLTATSTLSTGVNLPARRVIIRSIMFHGKRLDILTYKQMIGRAGRMGKDTAGESILICKTTERTITTSLLNSNFQPIESCLNGGSGPLIRALLEAVASEVAYTYEDIDNYMKCTLLSFINNHHKVEESTKEAIDFLVKNELLFLQTSEISEQRWIATQLGKACLAASVPPKDGLLLFEELQKARRCFVLETELHVIYLITPFNSSSQIGQINWFGFLEIWKSISESEKRVGQLVGVSESFLASAVRGSVRAGKTLDIHKRFYTALALHDLVREIPLASVCIKFDCCRGVIQSLQQTAATFAGMVSQFCKKLGWDCIELLVSQFQQRLQFGVCRELLDLLRLPMLNGIRARSLFKEGITTVAELAIANVMNVERALYKALPFESEKEFDGEHEIDVAKRNKIRIVFVTGRDGLLPREAAMILVKEARELVQYELGVQDVDWEKKNLSKSLTSQQKCLNNLLLESKSNIDCNYASTIESIIHEPSCSKVFQVEVEIPNQKENCLMNLDKNKLVYNLSTKTPEKIPLSDSHVNQASNHSSPSLFGDSMIIDTQECNILEQNIMEEFNTSVFDETNFSYFDKSKNQSKNIIKEKSDKNNISQVFQIPENINKSKSLMIWEEESWDITSDSMKITGNEAPSQQSSNKLEKKLLQSKLRLKNKSDLKSMEKLAKVTKRKIDSPPVNKSPIASVIAYESLRKHSTESNISEDDIIVTSQKMDILNSTVKTRTRIKLEAIRVRTQNSAKPSTKVHSRTHIKLNNNKENVENNVHQEPSINSVISNSDDEISSEKFNAISKTKNILMSKSKEKNKNNKAKKIDLNELVIVNISEITKFHEFKNELNKKKEISMALACEAFQKNIVSIGTKIIGMTMNYHHNDGEKKNKQVESCIYNDRKICGVAITWGRNIYYMSFDNVQEPNRVSIKERMALLTKILTNENLTIRCFSTKEVFKTLFNCCNISPSCHFLDPSVADWLLNPDLPNKMYASLITEYLPEGQILYQRLGLISGQLGPSLTIKSSISGKSRACTEVALTWCVSKILLIKLQHKNPLLLDHFRKVEMNTVVILSRMELTGFGVNLLALHELSQVIEKELKILENKAYLLAGKKFNFSSSRSVAQVLNLNQGNKVCTNKAVLENCNDPIAKFIINWRKLNAIYIKMVCPLLMLAEKNSRIHGNCVTNTVTGRVSMHEPNLQNVPRDFNSADDSFVISIRMAFVPALGNLILSADYCQLELRILAHLSNESVLCKILNKPGDVFKNIAAKWHNTLESNIDDTIRQRTKQLCYGMIYGMSIKSLSESLQVEETKAKEFFDTFMNTYPGIREWLDKIIESARNKGFVSTLMKRTRLLSGINSRVLGEKNQAERQAVNTTIQGSAADIAKMAMVTIDQRMRNEFPDMFMVLPDLPVKRKLRNSKDSLPRGGYLVLQLHDELIYEVNANNIEKVARIIKESMENCCQLAVPLPVKIKIGPAWGDLEEYKFD